jgi:hypothetical protein
MDKRVDTRGESGSRGCGSGQPYSQRALVAQVFPWQAPMPQREASFAACQLSAFCTSPQRTSSQRHSRVSAVITSFSDSGKANVAWSAWAKCCQRVRAAMAFSAFPGLSAAI